MLKVGDNVIIKGSKKKGYEKLKNQRGVLVATSEYNGNIRYRVKMEGFANPLTSDGAYIFNEYQINLIAENKFKEDLIKNIKELLNKDCCEYFRLKQIKEYIEKLEEKIEG